MFSFLNFFAKPVFKRFCERSPDLLKQSLQNVRFCKRIAQLNPDSYYRLVAAISGSRNERPFGSHKKAARPGGFFVPAMRGKEYH
ncbi:hypothetical protein [Delftia lacustris]|uniref:hypothetical protein n=1 Tax=Delftia lacustris TaxID=558537 RepID=UPI001FCD00E0|nr:hypothetical protein [Delftia lacustris]